MSAESRLTVADHHLAEMEDCIIRQVALIGHMAAKGQDTRSAERSLEQLMRDLEALREQRCFVADGETGAASS